MGANWNDYFIKLRWYGLMLSDYLKSKKIATVCAEKKVPILPYENNENGSIRMNKKQRNVIERK